MVKKEVGDQLWKLCNDLRPRLEASEYKHVVLRIYSLLALSKKAKDEPKRIEIPIGHNWGEVLKKVDEIAKDGKSLPYSAAKYVDEIMIKIAENNEEINDCFPSVFERLMIDNDTLNGLFQGFDSSMMHFV